MDNAILKVTRKVVAVFLMMQLVYGQDDGFNLLLTTSPDEYEDFPLEFDNPGPGWLRGDLVSSLHLFYL